MDGADWIMRNANWELCADCARCDCESRDHVCEVLCHDGQFCHYVGGPETEIEVGMPGEPEGQPTFDPAADINELPTDLPGR
ncbi:hypothetical protein ACIGG9_16130 [Pseudonocardia alni]|uniref:hypothetical protein n=1 Tax=Pseudonocardia alni TaxID=33907 RepID=UPI0033CEB599